MKYRLIYFLLFMLVFISCEKPKKDTIEIYLTKERIPNNMGVPFEEYISKNNLDSTGIYVNQERYKYNTYDSLNKRLIYLGDFDFTEADLQETPFITDDEFLGFDKEKNEFFLKVHDYERFYKLPYISQFVLVINKEPIISGYFHFSYSSEILYGTYIIYYPQLHDLLGEISQKTNRFLVAQGTKEGKYISNPNFQVTNPKFYQVLQTRNKENNLFQD